MTLPSGLEWAGVSILAVSGNYKKLDAEVMDDPCQNEE